MLYPSYSMFNQSNIGGETEVLNEQNTLEESNNLFEEFTFDLYQIPKGFNEYIDGYSQSEYMIDSLKEEASQLVP